MATSYDPDSAYDPIGCYWYIPGYCVRDSFAQALGSAHPLVKALNIRHVSNNVVFKTVARFGYQVVERGPIPRGPAVYIIQNQSGSFHAVYCDRPYERLYHCTIAAFIEV